MDGSQTCLTGCERSDAMGKSPVFVFFWVIFVGQSMSILIAVVPWAAAACGLARTKIAVWAWRHMADVIFMFSFYDSPCILSLRFSV